MHDGIEGQPDVDRVLARALAEAAEGIPVPGPGASWAALRQRLMAQQRRTARRRLLASLTAAAALALAIAVPVLAPDDTAPTAPVTPTPATPALRGEETQALAAHPETPATPTAHPEASTTAGASVAAALAEAARRAPFPVHVPAWLPAGAHLLGVDYREATPDRPVAVVLHLAAADGRTMAIEQEESVAAAGDRNTGARRVDVDGSPAFLIEAANGRKPSLTWSAGGVTYRIRSDWDGETTLRVARSLRPVSPSGP
ncbi:MAG: hypothetical protein IRY95_04620 [Clostridia bacterium]|nr:hypothetical protein [Clostridia bacterium]